MTPQRPFSGQAPSSMSMMGQGFSEAGANIGKMAQQGWAAMGEGVAKGISGYAQMAQANKQMEAQTKASGMMVDTLHKGGYLPDSVKQQYDEAMASPDLSARQKHAYATQMTDFAGNAVKQYYMENSPQADFYRAQAESLRRKAQPATAIDYGALVNPPASSQGPSQYGNQDLGLPQDQMQVGPTSESLFPRQGYRLGLSPYGM